MPTRVRPRCHPTTPKSADSEPRKAAAAGAGTEGAPDVGVRIGETKGRQTVSMCEGWGVSGGAVSPPFVRDLSGGKGAFEGFYTS